MKRIVLLLLITFIVNVGAWAANFEFGGISYYVASSSDLTVEVTNRYNKYSGDVVIPSSVTYEGTTYSVTRIGWSAFDGCSGLTSVEIPSSVTSIGFSAFDGCSGLTSVVIPSGVTLIGSDAFNGCSGLTSVEIPSSVTSIGFSAFSGCDNLKYNEYDNGLYLGNSENPYLYLVKAKSNEITSVKINDKTSIIASSAFYGSKVTRVDYTGTLEGWCNKQWNPSYISSSYDLYINGKKVEEVKIPSSVTEIGEGAFSGCSGLTSVSIPSNVVKIDTAAFYGCSALTSVEISEGVTDIGGSAFEDCTSLTSVAIPSGVTRIGNDAFEDCSGLTSVVIPSSVTEIGFAAFRDCSVLTSVTISEGVTSIGSDAFQGCYNLTSVTIPSTVTDIGVDAFPNPYDNEECKLSTITLLTKTHSVALKILGDYGTTADQYLYSNSHSKGYAAVYVADGLLPFYEWFWGQYYNFIEIGDVPNVINGEGGIASIVKVYNNKVDINVDLEEGYSVSEIKVNGKVVYTVSASNKSLSVDVFVIKNSETSFTLVGVTADDTIEVAYNKSTPTGVGVIEMQREVKGVYDIYGRKLTAPQRGINIIDGKKVIVK